MTAAALLVGLAMLGSDRPQTADPPAIREQRVEVDGHTIRALCTGGARRVMLWHAEGGDATDWRPVLQRLDGQVGACAFDRRGSGESGGPPRTRGWFEVVDELRRIHSALGFERDYVLVGHAVGGLYARAYAADRPTDLGGLVLVDPLHEDLLERLRTGMPPGDWEDEAAREARPNSDGVTERLVGARARRARLPAIPITVITAANRPVGQGGDTRFVNEATRQVHASILRGATSGRHVPADRSGPNVPVDRPGVVVNEILRIVRTLR